MEVTSRPSRRTAPPSGPRRPSMMFIAVVLPAPLGPMTPRASPGRTASVSPSRTRSEPKALATFRSSSSVADTTSGLGREGPQLAGGGNAGGRPVAHDRHVKAEILAPSPLAAHERSLGDV